MICGKLPLAILLHIHPGKEDVTAGLLPFVLNFRGRAAGEYRGISIHADLQLIVLLGLDLECPRLEIGDDLGFVSGRAIGPNHNVVVSIDPLDERGVAFENSLGALGIQLPYCLLNCGTRGRYGRGWSG